jgi:outer membrane protein TolC
MSRRYPFGIMSRIKRLFFICVNSICLCLLAGYNAHGQAKILTFEELLGVVKTYHPVLKQAQLETKRADAMVLEARGGFDPQLRADFERKRFSNDLYYSYLNPEIAIPTWYGIELYAGLEEIVGDRTNNESTLGKTSYLGISVPIGRDLLLDKRRAILQQSKAFQSQTLAEQQNTVNNVLFDATAIYWQWAGDYQIYRILTDAVQVNRSRLRFIVLEYEQGSRAAIDTTEAYTQLQTFEIMQAQAWLDFQNSGLELSTYMWLQNNVPFAWDPTVLPDTLALAKKMTTLPVLEEVLSKAYTMHPKLRSFDYKIDMLEIERRLKQNNLMPKFDLKANLLNKGYNVVKGVDAAFLQENYKIGFNFQMPLLLREARGALRQTDIKIDQTNYDLEFTRLQITNKVRAYYNEIMQLQKQLNTAEAAYENYLRLFRGEDLRFQVGESTLFLLNARENKLLESKQKVVELQAKLQKSLTGLYWAGGLLN